MGIPIFDPPPSPITKNFVIGDYVGDLYPNTKFGANPPARGFWVNA